MPAISTVGASKEERPRNPSSRSSSHHSTSSTSWPARVLSTRHSSFSRPPSAARTRTSNSANSRKSPGDRPRASSIMRRQHKPSVLRPATAVASDASQFGTLSGYCTARERSRHAAHAARRARPRTCCRRRGRSPPARWVGGDRRSAPFGCRRRGAPCDRPPARPAGGHGPRLAARRQEPGGEPAGVRDAMDIHAGPRDVCRRASRERARRRGRGDHARRPRMGAAIRARAHQPVGAGRVPDRRATRKPAGAPAVAVPHGRACGTTSSPSSCARRLRVKRRNSAPRPSRAPRRRLTPADGAATPGDGGFERFDVRHSRLTSSFVPHPRSPSKSARACRK